tara:strand:- start:2938 stop:3258 length:321 start_codon:yes stop_codon:yes gene_type:complete
MKKLNKSQVENLKQIEVLSKFQNLTNDQKIIARAELLINPLQFTKNNGCDSYICKVVDFTRNGKTLIYNFCGDDYKLQWNTKRNRYSPKYGFAYFSILKEKRNRER